MPGLLWFPLATDPSVVVHRTLAAHLNAPPEILARLAHDDAISVRLKVANHPRTDDEVLAELAKDRETVIRLAVVARNNTSVDILEWLARTDRNQAVRRASLARLQQRRKAPPWVEFQSCSERYSSL